MGKVIELKKHIQNSPVNFPTGLFRFGLHVKEGLKIGDLDPRDDPRYCTLISDKSLALGGSVLEAILSRAEIRKELWD